MSSRGRKDAFPGRLCKCRKRLVSPKHFGMCEVCSAEISARLQASIGPVRALIADIQERGGGVMPPEKKSQPRPQVPPGFTPALEFDIPAILMAYDGVRQLVRLFKGAGYKLAISVKHEDGSPLIAADNGIIAALEAGFNEPADDEDGEVDGEPGGGDA